MNILVVGLGSIAKKHLAALNTLDQEFNIYALRSNLNAETWVGITNVFDLNKLDAMIDFAIISNPTYLHYTVIEELADRNIPLFIEKPVVHSLNDIDRLIKKIEGIKLKTYVACNLRFHPCIEYLKKVLTDKLILNEVNVYCGSYLPEWRPCKNYKDFYSANADMGGGVHLDLFHEIDYISWIFGLAKTGFCILNSKSSLKIEAIDYANYILEYESYTISIILNYYRRKPKRIIEIVFDNETWTVDLINCIIKDDNDRLIFAVENFNILNTYKSQISYFLGCLEQKMMPMNTISESVEILKICLLNEK